MEASNDSPWGPSLQIGRIGGIPITFNGGIVVVAGLFVISLAVQGFPRIDPDASLRLRTTVALVTVFALLVSVLAHELGHAIVAKRHHINVLGINFSLRGAEARLDNQASTPGAEFKIAAAGPAVNILIGAALAASLTIAYQFELSGGLIFAALSWLAAINLLLAAFNLLPASPLDGGRILTAALWRRLRDAERARVISGRCGLILGVLVAAIGLWQLAIERWDGLVTVIVGFFLFNGARREIRTAVIRRRLKVSTPADVMVANPPPVADSLTIEELHRFAGPDRSGVAFPVVRWSPEPIGYIIPDAGAHLGDAERSWTKISQLMQLTPVVARAWLNESVDEVLRRADSTNRLMIVIHEPTSGQVVGTIGDQQITPLLESPDFWGRDKSPRVTPSEPQPEVPVPVLALGREQ